MTSADEPGQIEKRMVVEYGITLDEVWLPLAMLRRLSTHGPWDAPFTEASADPERVLLAHCFHDDSFLGRIYAGRMMTIGIIGSGHVGSNHPAGDPRRRALALAGDDPEAKHLVAGLYDEFGFDALDIGGLGESWRLDAGQPAFVTRQNLAELKANVARATRPGR